MHAGAAGNPGARPLLLGTVLMLLFLTISVSACDASVALQALSVAIFGCLLQPRTMWILRSLAACCSHAQCGYS